MRTLSYLPLVLLVPAALAQATPIPVPAFSSTFSGDLTRGFYFQAPIPFVITGAQVPDETMTGIQNIEIYTSVVAPPAFPGTITPNLVFGAYNQPVTGTPLSTGAILVNPGEWLIVLGACGTTPIQNSYAAPGSFVSNVLGAPITMFRGGTQNNINTTPGPHPIWSENAGSIGRVELFVVPATGFIQPPELVATSEPLPNTNPLATGNGTIQDLDFLRWNYTDPGNNNAGLLVFTAINVGQGGSSPIGVTPQIPNFDQVWAGSTPMGVADVTAPIVMGGQDLLTIIPPGFFMPGDTVRLQGLTLDTRVTGPLPVNSTLNTVEYTYRTSCVFREDFDGVAPGGPNYPTGWVDGGGTQMWQVDDAGTPSAATGPSGATTGTNYIYCETSAPVTATDTFIINSRVYPTNGLIFNSVGFDLSRVGVAIGTLEVRMDDGTGTFATLLGTYTGPDPSGNEWTTESLPLPSPPPANVSFQFSYTGVTTFTGDIAIDSFCMQ